LDLHTHLAALEGEFRLLEVRVRVRVRVGYMM
jgi:hypothetical protein